ncbi:hypothetical protein G7059_07970 [Erysipelothrix sp. HDW6A]|uniref:hypothetical protein n=1 Tax=Erysipelothrix sp. HDW6A TaxID=2714928 RepID=UPI00140A6A6D|nr:hypothetical protein [Erysipelothrix sp. HDW6A]QIK57778.1 hypothetical protein G7059_07970 [Erysipelothrix sp. HDW6A]
MRIVKNFFIKMYKLYRSSYFSVHIFLILLSFALYFFIRKYNVLNVDQVFTEVLNGMGILTSFFILVIDKINVKSLGDRYPNRIRCGFIKKYSISEGIKLMNTIFSLTISMFAILGTNYILLLFGVKNVVLLTCLIVYIFVSFIIAISIWHAFELKGVE